MSVASRSNPTARPARRRSVVDESWFGAFGSTGDAPSLADDSRFTVSWLNDSEAAQARVSGTSRSIAESTFARIYGAFIAARAAIGVALIVTVALTGAFGARPTTVVTAVSILYATLAISMWLLPRFRRGAAPQAFARLTSPQWLATIGADLTFFTALHIASPGSSFNYVALLVLPVLMAGVLTPRVLALATAAVATLALLGTAWLGLISGGEPTLLMTQAGLAGSGFFVITVLAGELAGRLAREQLSARGSLEMARQQAQLNRLVIEEMEDGVLVVDRAGKVRAANPAARRLLAPEGTSRTAPFQLRGVPAWGALVRAVERAFADAAWPEAGRDVALQFAPDVASDASRACPLHEEARAARRARSSASSFSRTSATCRRAAARKSWRRWGASRPASRTRSATRWPRSRRPTPCSPRTRPTRRSAS